MTFHHRRLHGMQCLFFRERIDSDETGAVHLRHRHDAGINRQIGWGTAAVRESGEGPQYRAGAAIAFGTHYFGITGQTEVLPKKVGKASYPLAARRFRSAFH